MSCCNRILDFCTISHCSSLTFGISEQTATLIGIFNHNGIETSRLVAVESGSPYSIDLTTLNESSEYEVRFITQSGTPVELQVNDEIFDCVRFRLSTANYELIPDLCTGVYAECDYWDENYSE